MCRGGRQRLLGAHRFLPVLRADRHDSLEKIGLANLDEDVGNVVVRRDADDVAVEPAWASWRWSRKKAGTIIGVPVVSRAT